MTATDLLALLAMYSLGLFFPYFLLNYAGLTAKPAAWLKATLGPRIGYPLSCAFCWAAWITAFLWVIGIVPPLYVFAAPTIHLLLDSVYDRLSGPSLLPPT